LFYGGGVVSANTLMIKLVISCECDSLVFRKMCFSQSHLLDLFSSETDLQQGTRKNCESWSMEKNWLHCYSSMSIMIIFYELLDNWHELNLLRGFVITKMYRKHYRTGMNQFIGVTMTMNWFTHETSQFKEKDMSKKKSIPR
jgi:hypothetical protein